MSPDVVRALVRQGVVRNRRERRAFKRVGARIGKVEFISVRVERADGRCTGRKLVRHEAA